MTQPKEWLAVSLVKLFVLTVSFAKATIEPGGGLPNSMEESYMDTEGFRQMETQARDGHCGP
jgi:hypothetical protein